MHHGDVSPEIAQGLIALKNCIDGAQIPPSKLDESINVAVWNIREFGKSPRTTPAIHYLAEILGQFDLIALVELRDNLDDLGKVLPILGPSWDVVYSDWIADDGGNKERIGFLFDDRAVSFNGLAAEVDAPRVKSGQEFLAKQSFWRAPYMCSFRAGNFDFIAIATHARWGTGTTGRKAELQMLADWIAARVKDKSVEDHDIIVMGDFNTPQMDDALFKALTSGDLKVPQPLVTLKAGETVLKGSNLGNDARYDQILYQLSPLLASAKSGGGMPANAITAGGTLDFYPDAGIIEKLFPGQKYTLGKFSFQLSDHLPVWVQVKTDIDGARLNQIIQDNKNP